MSRFLTASNAAIVSISGAILWLARVPSIEFGVLESEGGGPLISVLSTTTSGTAVLGLAAIALGTALHGLATGRRSSSAAAGLMVAGLVVGIAAFLNQADFVQLTFLGFALPAAAWFVLAAADRSPAALLAAVGLLLHALAGVPDGPLATSFGVQELAPALFGLGALLFLVLRSREPRRESNPELALAA